MSQYPPRCYHWTSRPGPEILEVLRDVLKWGLPDVSYIFYFLDVKRKLPCGGVADYCDVVFVPVGTSSTPAASRRISFFSFFVILTAGP